jgi:hypothetical protein
MINKKGAMEFNSKHLIKLLIVTFSSFFWIYFLISSKLTAYAFRVFDIATILNSIFSLNFLFFVIFFPITSIIILSIIYNSVKKESLIIVGVGLFLSFIFSVIFLKLNIYFILFLILYISAHLILCLIVKKTSEKNLFNQTTDYLSKLTIFLIIGLFISSAIYILPEQNKKVEEFEAGLVNLFIADNIDPWISTSYIINQQCTLSNLKYIMESREYLELRIKTDETSSDFTDFMENLKTSAAANKTTAEIKELMPDLDAPVIKVKIIDTIKAIPFMGFIESNFAFFFALAFSSFVYTGLSIVFLIFAAIVYLFNKIFKEEEE